MPRPECFLGSREAIDGGARNNVCRRADESHLPYCMLARCSHYLAAFAFNSWPGWSHALLAALPNRGQLAVGAGVSDVVATEIN